MKLISSTYKDTYRSIGYAQSLSQVIKGKELNYTTSLKFLVNFDLSSNNFVGHIPDELILLDGLKGLNLSNNQLTGEIPKELGNLKSLESLDLSKNLLSGGIPQSVSHLGFLGAINLSFNNLSGKIPYGQQFQTFGSSSYIGNLQLCGFPLEKNCSQDTPSQVTDQEGNVDKADDGMSGFYIGMAVGTVAGFWGVCVVLMFKKTWR
ncbi:lysine--tRNA ligase [Ranunculus cassubicifolius]